MRLGKFLAHGGIASRRAAEQLIRDGLVTVAGEIVLDPATDVGAASDVRVQGEPVAGAEARAVHMLNKPRGVVSTARDTHERPTVVELVPSRARLYPVGRLDADSTGLILLTNDGELANLLTHPRHGVPKLYRARVAGGRPSDRTLALLRKGIELDDGPTAPAQVRWRGRGMLELELREGRKRQVRRMCEAVGHPVLALARVRFGPLELGDLGLGRHRRLSPAEVAALRAAAPPGRPG